MAGYAISPTSDKTSLAIILAGLDDIIHLSKFTSHLNTSIPVTILHCNNYKLNVRNRAILGAVSGMPRRAMLQKLEAIV